MVNVAYLSIQMEIIINKGLTRKYLLGGGINTHTLFNKHTQLIHIQNIFTIRGCTEQCYYITYRYRTIGPSYLD